ncbi:MAG: hypothetical protein SPL08_03400 [Pseudomonadota bacterium]|nr:hypothetical protein [Pseudomonadota bacterium]
MDKAIIIGTCPRLRVLATGQDLRESIPPAIDRNKSDIPFGVDDCCF